MIALTSNVVGLFELVNMNHIQLDYTIVPTTARLLKNRRRSGEKERERDIYISARQRDELTIRLHHDSAVTSESIVSDEKRRVPLFIVLLRLVLVSWTIPH